MSKSATSRLAEEKASLKRRKLVRRSRLRKAFAWVLASALTTQSLFAQNAQNAGSPSSGGLVNQMGASLQRLEQNGPGLFYYGVNGADRGLGYQGSYMTVGGFIPYAEDDMGGFWSADLRGHLSNYGGFFSNVGVVRQQFLGGALGTFGLYWDYDGDLNQYPTSIAGGNSFGHAYSQIGLSGALLTDFGNLRSNGYMPTGTTGFTQGSPGSPFYQNVIMAQYGLDAALTGVDLEVGAYIPGLADWAGMWSVGGYAFGNIKDKYSNGTPVVPNFGGVYSRIDVTLANNWDFQIQANNDSFFDWTGYARLTYRVGGSRRRSVADQIEQPPQRNEHIVRAHNTPIVAINPATGTPWRVIHVNNTSNSLGTAESPYPTLAQGNAAATNPWDIVFVDQGDGTATGYNTAFSFQAVNQYLVGNGAAFYVPTANAGLINIATNLDGTKPLLTNPSGASVIIGSAGAGAVVSNFQITGSNIGIQGTGLLSSGIARTGPAPFADTTGTSIINNVFISGNSTTAPQAGVVLDSTTNGDITFFASSIAGMTKDAIRIEGGNANVNFQGSISNASPTSYAVNIANTTGGTVNLAVGGTPATSGVNNEIVDTGGLGIQIQTTGSAAINIGNASLTDNVNYSINVENDNSGSINFTDATINNNTALAAIRIVGPGSATVLSYNGTVTNTNGFLLSVNDLGAGSNVLLTGGANPSFVDTGDGIQIVGNSGALSVQNARIGSKQNGVLISNSNGSHTFTNLNVTAAAGAGNAGVNIQNSNSVNFVNADITTSGVAGLLGNNVNSLTINGGSSVNTTGAAAISLTGVLGGTTTLESIASTDSTTSGVLLDNVSGTFGTTGGITITNPGSDGFVMRNSPALIVTVPSLTVTQSGTALTTFGNAVVLQNNAMSLGQVTFNTVNLTTENGVGLFLRDADVLIGGGSIAATGGAAIDANVTTLSNINDIAITLASASSSDSAATGISILSSDNTLGYPGVSIGSTTVANAGTFGVYLQNNIPSTPASGVLAAFGSLNVTGSGQAGVYVQNTNASFSGATIGTSGTHAVELVAQIGENTTVAVSGSQLSGATNNGVNILATGGTVNATILNNQIGATGNSINAITQDNAATISLNLNGNSGIGGGAPTAGTIVLNNTAAGTFNVTQSAVVGPPVVSLGLVISQDNTSAVDITTISGTLTEGQIIPAP